MDKTEQLSPRRRKLYIGDLKTAFTWYFLKMKNVLLCLIPPIVRFMVNAIKYTNALKCHDPTAKDVGKVYSPINKPYSIPLACVVCRRLMTALIMHSCLSF